MLSCGAYSYPVGSLSDQNRCAVLPFSNLAVSNPDNRPCEGTEPSWKGSRQKGRLPVRARHRLRRPQVQEADHCPRQAEQHPPY